MKRATSSLPVPLSPRMSTVALEGAACVATSSTRLSAGLEPTISRRVRSLISLRSERFSATSDCRSAALRTLLMIVIRLSGFSTKS